MALGNARNELIRGETGWSTFEERSKGNGEMDVEWCLKRIWCQRLVEHV